MRENVQNLAKYAAHICGAYVAYFSTYLWHMQICVMGNQKS